MASEGYHEPIDLLSEETKNFHRAIVSLIEELDAIDWYNQRAEVCRDADLKAVLLHHRDEEVEHAIMNLEWIRRRHDVFDRNLRKYLFTQGDLTTLEAEETGGPSERGSVEHEGKARPPSPAGSLGLGSLRAGEEA